VLNRQPWPKQSFGSGCILSTRALARRPWQVLAAGAAESRFEALRAATTPLVGRPHRNRRPLRAVVCRKPAVAPGRACIGIFTCPPPAFIVKHRQRIVPAPPPPIDCP
jgi:hypothetical protein